VREAKLANVMTGRILPGADFTNVPDSVVYDYAFDDANRDYFTKLRY